MMKKMLLMLILAASMMTVAKAAEKYAVLITGDTHGKSLSGEIEEGPDRIFATEFWNDTYLQWELLVDKKGYKPENIIVLYRLGKDYWKELIDAGEATLHERYTPQHLPYIEEGLQITNFPATRKSLDAVYDILTNEKHICEDDFLYVWTFGHGGYYSASTSFISMLEETYSIDPETGETILEWKLDQISDDDFAKYFVDLPAKKKVYSMAQCSSGGFKDNLTKNFTDKSVFFDSSSKIMESAWGADNIAPNMSFPGPFPYLEKEKFGDQTFIHSEYNFHKYGAYAGLNPQFQDYYHLGFTTTYGFEQPPVYFIEADKNSDGVISVEEARSWNEEQNTQNETQDMSDPGNIGYHTSLDYATLLLKDDCSNPDSYVYENPAGLNGMVGISQSISTNPQNELILNNSNTTLLPGRNISVITGSKFSIKNSDFSGAGFNKSLVKGDDSDFLLENAININSATIEFLNSNVSGIGISRARYSTVKTGGTLKLDNVYFNLTWSDLELFSDTFLEVSSGSELILGSKAVTGVSNSNIEVKNSGILTMTDVGVSNVGIVFSNNITSAFIGNIGLSNSGINLTNNSTLTLKPFSKTIIDETSSLTVGNGSTLVLSDGSELILVGGAVATFEKGSQIIIEGSAKITGNIANTYASIIINDNSKLTLGTGSNFTLSYNEANSVTGGINSEVVIESGAVLNFNPTTPCVMNTGSKITVEASGKLFAYENSFSGNPVWNGIIAEVGSNVSLVNSSVKNAQIGLSAIGANVNVNWSSFVDCYNGVSLTNCTGYALNNNYFKGMYSGYDSGISLTECGGSITGNTVTNFGRGVILTLSSVNLIKNKINANRLSGVYVTGYNVPQMKNPSGKIELNNEIKNNGDVQVLLIYHANVYLADGYNNIYSDPINSIPSVPCIYTAGWQIGSSDQLNNKAVLPNIVGINAQSNYWGYSGKISDNFDSFFGVGINSLHQGYTLSYEPYAVEPYTAEPGINPRLSSNEPPTAESKLLSTALMLEDKGNIKPSIKKYEQILSKYPDSPEAYVANARLPELYLQAERDVNELLMAYDEALESEVTTDKKFFKQMKITANTKSAKYDDAISIAEKMKTEAENEAEVTLADLSIAIAETMKNNGKSNVRTGSNTISDLLAKLSGKGGEEQTEEPSGITETALPLQHELFQNYPNPFNPVTQINFALSKTADVKLSVYNINGQKVAELANGSRQAGVHAVDFDGSKLNSGVYYYTLETDGMTMTKKMVLTK